MKLFSKKTVEYVLVVLLLILSGNPIITASPNIREIYIIVAISLFTIDFYSYKLSLQNKFFLYVLPFVFISVCQLIFLNVTFSSALFFLIKVYIGYSIIQRLGTNFMVTYSNVMFLVAFISLPLYLYNSLYGIIPGKPISDICVSLGVYTELFNETSDFIGRNSGMFWEPGAFQGYLNIAIAFILLLPEISKRNLKLLILCLAVITTKSTTGYLVLFVIIFYYILFLSRANKLTRMISLFFFTMVAVYILFSLDFLHEKILNEFMGSSNSYKEGRVYDYVRFRSLIRENFLFGMSDQVADKAYTGNGFLSFLLYYGIFGIVNYFVMLWYNYKRQVTASVAIYIIIVVLLSLQGEGFIYYPLYLALPLVSLDRRLLTIRSAYSY